MTLRRRALAGRPAARSDAGRAVRGRGGDDRSGNRGPVPPGPSPARLDLPACRAVRAGLRRARPEARGGPGRSLTASLPRPPAPSGRRTGRREERSALEARGDARAQAAVPRLGTGGEPAEEVAGGHASISR